MQVLDSLMGALSFLHSWEKTIIGTIYFED